MRPINPNTPNSLWVALYGGKGGVALLATLRAPAQTVVVAEDGGGDALTLLDHALLDLRRLCARHISVYTNIRYLATLYTFPVRLEPTAPDRTHLYDPRQWDIVRLLSGYATWRVTYADRLPNAQALWEDMYGNHH